MDNKSPKPGIHKLSKKQLKEFLRTYFLSVPESPMENVIKDILGAFSLGRPINIQESSQIDINEIRLVADAFGLQISESEGIEIEIPDYRSRFCDLQLLIPFHIQNILNDRVNYISIKKIETLAILVWYILISFSHTRTLDNIIEHAVIRMSDEGVISFENNCFRDIPKFEFHDLLCSLSETACLYLGFKEKNFSQDKERRVEGIDHCVNKIREDPWFYMRDSDEIRPYWFHDKSGVFNFPKFKYPVLMRNFYCRPEDIGFHAKNLWNLLKNPEVDNAKVQDCLNLRIQNKSESEIAKALKFRSESLYTEWLREHNIDINSVQKNSIYEDWQVACEALGVTPIQSKAIQSTHKVEIDNRHVDKEQNLLPKIQIAVGRNEVIISGKSVESIFFNPRKYKPAEALAFMLGQHQNGKEEIPGRQIMQSAGVERKPGKHPSLRDVFRSYPEIYKLIKRTKYGFYKLEVNIKESKISTIE